MSARISHLSHHLCASSSPIEKSGGLRIRQVALVVENLEKSIEEFSKALQLNATEVGSFRDPHIYILGLRNCVFNIGDQFLELVCPEDKDNTAYKQIQRRKGDGGYMVMLQTSNLLQDEERLSKDGFKTVLNVDLNEIKEIHLHPKQTSNCVVSLSQPDFPENWHWGGPNWRKNSPSPKSKQVLGVIIQSDNILKTIEQYQKLLNMQAKQISEDEYIFAINSIQNLKIQKAKDGRGDGLYGIEVEAARPEYANSTITVCGLVNIMSNKITPTYSLKERKKYQDVIFETLRLYPTVPSFPRECYQDTTLSGFDVPKASLVLVSKRFMNRDPKQWDQVEEFVPNRFEKYC